MKSRPSLIAFFLFATTAAANSFARGDVILTSQQREATYTQIATPTAFGLANGATPLNYVTVFTAPDFSPYSVGSANGFPGSYSSSLTAAGFIATFQVSYQGTYYPAPAGNLLQWTYETSMQNQVTFQIDQTEQATLTYTNAPGTFTLPNAMWSAPLNYNQYSGQITATLTPGTYTFGYSEAPSYIDGDETSVTFALVPEPSTFAATVFAIPLLLRRRRSARD